MSVPHTNCLLAASRLDTLELLLGKEIRVIDVSVQQQNSYGMCKARETGPAAYPVGWPHATLFSLSMLPIPISEKASF